MAEWGVELEIGIRIRSCRCQAGRQTLRDPNRRDADQTSGGIVEEVDPALLASVERRQFHQIFSGHGFDRLPGFAPGGKASHQNKRIESLLAEYVRHPGAGGLACSSAVEINIPIFRTRL